MKGKPLEMTVLFDFYGEVLTDKQREFFDLYYNEDLSLGEIAENEGITRQGVRDAIHRAELSLSNMETRLGLYARYGNLPAKLDKIRGAAQEIARLNSMGFSNADIDRRAKDIIEAASGYLEDELR